MSAEDNFGQLIKDLDSDNEQKVNGEDILSSRIGGGNTARDDPLNVDMLLPSGNKSTFAKLPPITSPKVESNSNGRNIFLNEDVVSRGTNDQTMNQTGDMDVKKKNIQKVEPVDINKVSPKRS